jgi:hypothetical protein
MEKLQLIVENNFVKSGSNNKDAEITVFDRVFSKLVIERGPLGKVQPIYLEVKESLKVLGVLTLNVSGSYSFFPELPGEPGFDHFTFLKKYNGYHHLTKVSERGREKILPISAEPLANGILHGISFIIGDVSLLKDAPKEIHYPEAEIADINRVKEAFFTSGKQEGSTILKNNSLNGTVCVQFFLIPKKVDFKQLSVYPTPIKKFLGKEIKGKISVFNAVIPHEYQNEYSLGMVYFHSNKKIDLPLMILFSTQREGFYSKIPFKYVSQ